MPKWSRRQSAKLILVGSSPTAASKNSTKRKRPERVACIDVLRDFWRSNGDEDGIFMPRVIENQGRRLRIRTHGAVTFCLAGNRVSWLGFQNNPSRLQSLPVVCDAKESAVLKDSFLSAASRKRTSLATISV